MKNLKKFIVTLLVTGVLVGIGVEAKAYSIDGPTIPPMSRRVIVLEKYEAPKLP